MNSRVRSSKSRCELHGPKLCEYLYLISCFGIDLPWILSTTEWSFTSGTLQSCTTARAVEMQRSTEMDGPSSECSEMEVSVCVFALLFFKQRWGICFRLNPWENSSEFNNLVILTPLAFVQGISIHWGYWKYHFWFYFGFTTIGLERISAVVHIADI